MQRLNAKNVRSIVEFERVSGKIDGGGASICKIDDRLHDRRLDLLDHNLFFVSVAQVALEERRLAHHDKLVHL